MGPGALHHGFRRRVAVLFQKAFFQAASVDTDTDGNVLAPALFRYGTDILLAADVARIDADGIRSPVGTFQCQPIIEMNVTDDGYGGTLLQGGNSFRRFHIRYRDPDNVTSGSMEIHDLSDGGIHIPGLGIAHGLYRNCRVTADRHIAHHQFFCQFPFRHIIIPHCMISFVISLNITTAIRPSSRTMPTALM